ncbi:MAG: IS3 family transposase [Thermomicrobia bacterium]|nr:IS3 family transposase [Thermomicrobia bacterium]
MRTSRFTEQQVVAALRQAENGTAVGEVCRKLGVSEQTFYRWKRKYAGIGVAELRRLRQVEDENRRLKQLVADLTLDRQMLQEAPKKKLVTPARRRAVVQFFRAGFQVSERRACRVAAVPRTTMRYRSQARDQSPLRLRLRELAAVRVRYGYRRLHILLRREGWRVNAKRVYRLYREEGLSLRLKRPKKRVSVLRVTPPPAQRPNERWSIDFLKDSLADGRPFRVFTIVDNVSRVSPAIVADFSIKGERVVAVLDRLKAKALDAWAYRNGMALEFSRPGKPTDNAFVESFNGHFRQECLDQHWFASLEEARQIIEGWRIEYNTERPHQALKYGTPTEFAATWEPPEEAAD